MWKMKHGRAMSLLHFPGIFTVVQKRSTGGLCGEGVTVKHVLRMRVLRRCCCSWKPDRLMVFIIVTLVLFFFLTFTFSNGVAEDYSSAWIFGGNRKPSSIRQFAADSLNELLGGQSMGDSTNRSTESRENTVRTLEVAFDPNKDNLVPANTKSDVGKLNRDEAFHSTTEVVKSAAVNPMDLDFLETGSVLLAGVPRRRRVEFTIGMVTVSRAKGNYFFDTLASLLSKSSADDRRELTIVVMLADRNQSYNARVLSDLQKKHPNELQEGLLLAVRKPNTDFLFEDKGVKRTYNDSLVRVRWRSKQNLDYAALLEFCANLSTYYLHLEDDVIAADNYLPSVRDFIKANALKPWAMLEVCPHGFIGKLFKTKDLPKLVMILRAFYIEQPCDFLIKPYFINLMTQAKPIVRKTPLFFHRGRFSSLKDVVRGVDKIPSKGANENGVVKESRAHKNPPASVFTTMAVYDGNVVANAYNPQSKTFFWATDVREGQHVSIVFDAPQKLEKLVIETGFSDKDQKDILYKGSVEVGSDTPNLVNTTRCPNAQKTGQFTAGRFEAAVTSEGVRCISIVINEKQREWLIIRAILVFVKK